LVFSRFVPCCAADLSLRSLTGSRVRSPLEIFFFELSPLDLAWVRRCPWLLQVLPLSSSFLYWFVRTFVLGSYWTDFCSSPM
jgi:hypothetical protein